MRTALLAVLMIAVQATPAHAAFPGQNGKIVFQGAGDTWDIYSINPDGTGQTQLTNNSADDEFPKWSPDGTKIVFNSFRDGDWEVYVMNADGTGQTNITNRTPWDLNPAWSPDGSKIVYQRGDGAGNRPFYTMNPDGSGQTFLCQCNRVGTQTLAWSPDGTKIAFDRHQDVESPSRIWTVNANGTGEQTVCCDNQPAATPNWRPDGSQIAFWTGTATAIVNQDGTGVHEVGPPTAKFPAWSPDGGKIAFGDATIDTNYVSDIYLMNPDGSGVVPVTTAGDALGATNPDWQPILKGYPRPKAATPIYASLVPAYQACDAGSATKTHAPPLADGSCAAAQASDQLTVGSFDANAKAANSTGYIRMVRLGDLTTPADDSDVRLVSDITDVRNQSDLSDYTGELQAKLGLRITDKLSTPYPGGPGPGTVSDTTFSFTIPCAATPDTTIGSQCFLDTTADTVLPGIAPENKRAIWQTDQVKVYDGGPDGDADTGPNTLFMVQGVFAP